jgi:hypothetical protein
VILAPPLWATGSWVDDSWADGTWATTVVIHEFQVNVLFYVPEGVRVFTVPPAPIVDAPERTRVMVSE